MIVVTGGTGLLGSHLLYELAKNNQPIRAIYRDKERINLVSQLFDFYNAQSNLSNFKSIEWFRADILDIPSLEQAFQGANHIYHCAGMVSFARGDFSKLMKINREGTANVVNVALNVKVKKLCHVSSTAAIGGHSNIMVDESMKLDIQKHTSGYSISKYSAEKEVWRGIEEGLDAVIVNPSVIFGAGNWQESSLTIFRTIQNGLRFYTKGCNAFVDARDVASIMVELMESNIKNERFLCTGTNQSFKAIFDMIARKLQKPLPSIHTPKWLMGLTWRISGIWSFLRGHAPTLTKASARSAYNQMQYDNSKVKKALNFNFRNIEDCIDNAIKGKLS